MKEALYELSLIQAQQLIAKGVITKEDYLEGILDRIADVEPHLHLFVDFDPQALRTNCSKLSAVSSNLKPNKPLLGIPIGVKDIIDTQQLKTERGSKAFKGRIAPKAASVVQSIEEHGGLVLGKTVTTEFAWRSPGLTRNPWNLAHTPGGSSSGSAAGVASHCMPAALGTQTLGSIIRPAAYCGVVGFKPSFGTIPRTGVYPLSPSLDHIGVFTRSVEDAAYLTSFLIQNDGIDFPHHSPLPIPSALNLSNWSDAKTNMRSPKIALLKTSKWSRVSGEQQQLIDKTALHLFQSGGDVSVLDLPPSFDCIWDMADTIQFAEAAEINEHLAREEPCRISSLTQTLVMKGLNVPMLEYVKAKRKQQELIARFTQCLRGIDAVLTTPSLGEAPKGLEDTGDAIFCTPFTFLGAPAITLPAGYSSNGLPLGIQLANDWGSDARLLSVAVWVENALRKFYTPRNLELKL
jgi:amidase